MKNIYIAPLLLILQTLIIIPHPSTPDANKQGANPSSSIAEVKVVPFKGNEQRLLPYILVISDKLFALKVSRKILSKQEQDQRSLPTPSDRPSTRPHKLSFSLEDLIEHEQVETITPTADGNYATMTFSRVKLSENERLAMGLPSPQELPTTGFLPYDLE